MILKPAGQAAATAAHVGAAFGQRSPRVPHRMARMIAGISDVRQAVTTRPVAGAGSGSGSMVRPKEGFRRRRRSTISPCVWLRTGTNYRRMDGRTRLSPPSASRSGPVSWHQKMRRPGLCRAFLRQARPHPGQGGLAAPLLKPSLRLGAGSHRYRPKCHDLSAGRRRGFALARRECRRWANREPRVGCCGFSPGSVMAAGH